MDLMICLCLGLFEDRTEDLFRIDCAFPFIS